MLSALKQQLGSWGTFYGREDGNTNDDSQLHQSVNFRCSTGSYDRQQKGNYFPCITVSEQAGGKTRKGEDFLAACKKVKKSGVLETGEYPT